jgi:hypothetical protein
MFQRTLTQNSAGTSTILINISHGYPEELGYGSRYTNWLWAGQPMGWSSRPGRGMIFLLSTSTRPVLGPTQPTQWILGAKLTTHPQLLQKSRIHGSIRPLPHMSSRRSA